MTTCSGSIVPGPPICTTVAPDPATHWARTFDDAGRPIVEMRGLRLKGAARNALLQAAPTTEEWGLLSEPWIFVVDGDGIVTGSFEGVVGEAELERALAEVEG